jgi:deoxyribodipyrimidine photo-lyase
MGFADCFAGDSHARRIVARGKSFQDSFLVWFAELRRCVGMYLPQRSAALAALQAFVPHAGETYASRRNIDPGPGQPAHVSGLSPWIRTRMLTEWEVIDAVLQQHSPTAAAKFIDEVCWRSYWKGWLQLRPTIWQDYRRARAALLERYQDQPQYRRAISGCSGIECFDAWAAELLESGYLHNHARMWVASIWVHTLQLPWELGADWFLRHLLDGDAAVNTLSWRWVAGLQTPGKTYLARPENIRQCTLGRFAVTESLAQQALPIRAAPLPAARTLSPLPEPPQQVKLSLIVTEEDLSSPTWLSDGLHPRSSAGFFPRAAYHALQLSAKVIEFRYQSLANSCAGPILESCDAVVDWMRQQQLQGICLAEPPVGHWNETLAQLQQALQQAELKLYPLRHAWDAKLYPHATHGYFRFKKARPLQDWIERSAHAAEASTQRSRRLCASPQPDGDGFQVSIDSGQSRKLYHCPAGKEPEPHPHAAGSYHNPQHHQQLMQRYEHYLRSQQA